MASHNYDRYNGELDFDKQIHRLRNKDDGLAVSISALILMYFLDKMKLGSTWVAVTIR
jgi:hypothetical protein